MRCVNCLDLQKPASTVSIGPCTDVHPICTDCCRALKEGFVCPIASCLREVSCANLQQISVPKNLEELLCSAHERAAKFVAADANFGEQKELFCDACLQTRFDKSRGSVVPIDAFLYETRLTRDTVSHKLTEVVKMIETLDFDIKGKRVLAEYVQSELDALILAPPSELLRGEVVVVNGRFAMRSIVELETALDIGLKGATADEIFKPLADWSLQSDARPRLKLVRDKDPLKQLLQTIEGLKEGNSMTVSTNRENSFEVGPGAAQAVSPKKERSDKLQLDDLNSALLAAVNKISKLKQDLLVTKESERRAKREAADWRSRERRARNEKADWALREEKARKETDEWMVKESLAREQINRWKEKETSARKDCQYWESREKEARDESNFWQAVEENVRAEAIAWKNKESQAQSDIQHWKLKEELSRAEIVEFEAKQANLQKSESEARKQTEDWMTREKLARNEVSSLNQVIASLKESEREATLKGRLARSDEQIAKRELLQKDGQIELLRKELAQAKTATGSQKISCLFNRQPSAFFGSKILYEAEAAQLHALIPNLKITKLLIGNYGFDTDFAADFHKACDHTAGTLVVAKYQDFIAGGYNDLTWEGDGVYKESSKAFLFSLDQNRVYPVKNQKMAINCTPSIGPAFGGNFIRL